MARFIRTARGAVIAFVFALVVAAPGAAEGHTHRHIPREPLQVVHYPAGTGCEFDVTVSYRGHNTVTVDDLGRSVSDTRYFRYTIVNDATGKKLVTNIVHHEVDWYDEANDVYEGWSVGNTIYQFMPGDVGPDGAVADHVYAILIKGKMSYVVDGTTYATSAISVHGTYTDICATISGPRVHKTAGHSAHGLRRAHERRRSSTVREIEEPEQVREDFRGDA